MHIKNYKKLATTSLRKKALEIIETGLESLNIKHAVNEKIKLKDKIFLVGREKYNLEKFERIYLLGIGKGSLQLAKELERKFKTNNLALKKLKNGGGVILDVEKSKLKYIKSEKGTHPLPSSKNVRITKKIIEILKKAKEKDLIIFLICGGGSALGFSPYKKSVQEYQTLTKKLFRTGANIYEINTIRKHTSNFKGGETARLAYPATMVSLIISDVPGDDPKFIASGPTVKDSTTVNDAKRIAKKYDLRELNFKETPKDPKYFKKVKNILFLSNKTALDAMKKGAQNLGFKTRIYSRKIQGEARELGGKIVLLPTKKEVILAGGETTVTVRGKGKGGRNQELVLGALPHIKDDEVIISIGSDGWDNSEAAGAIGDKLTLEKAKKLGLDIQKYLDTNDSFNFFKKTGDHIFTPRGINVADLILVIRDK